MKTVQPHVPTFDNRTDDAITWRKTLRCGKSTCTKPLPDLEGKLNPDSVWKKGKEYHDGCWRETGPSHRCEICGRSFDFDDLADFRQHYLTAHNDSSVSSEKQVRMYIPDGMINDRNMAQVLKENDLLRPHRVRCLQVAVELFTRLGIRYFISDGTLLGAFRENGKMIASDIDVDISIFEEDLRKLWEGRYLLPDGYLLDTISGDDWSTKLDLPFKMVGAKKFTLVDVNDYSDLVVETMPPECDIYTYRIDEEGFFRNNYAKTNQAVHLRKWRQEWILPLREMEFEGLKVLAPHDPEKYLTELYGYIGRDAFWNPETKYYEKLPSSSNPCIEIAHSEA